MTASEETWAEIERAWRETLDPPGEIGIRFGVHVLEICTHARLENWIRPNGLVFSTPPKARRTLAAKRKRTAPLKSRRASTAKVERTPAAKVKSKTAAGPAQPPRPKLTRRPGETISDRLLRLADRNLDFLEEQMESPDGLKNPADRERATKLLDATTRIVDKLKVMRTDDERANDQPGLLSGADIERRRIEIAERLERIQARRKATAGSE